MGEVDALFGAARPLDMAGLQQTIQLMRNGIDRIHRRNICGDSDEGRQSAKCQNSSHFVSQFLSLMRPILPQNGKNGADRAK
jgi:hypothetical protein